MAFEKIKNFFRKGEDPHSIGFFGEDIFSLTPNSAKLSGHNGIATYARMRDDAACAAVPTFITTAITSARWRVVSEDMETVEKLSEQMGISQEGAPYTSANGVSMAQILPELLTATYNGVAVSEIVHDRSMSMIGLGSVEHRPAGSLHAEPWVIEDGRLAQIRQNAITGGSGQTKVMDADACLVVSIGRKGNNYWGRSTLRSAYPAWFDKQKVMLLMVLGLERLAIPIMVASLRDEMTLPSPDQATKMDEVLKKFADGKISSIRGDSVHEIDLLESRGRGMIDPLAAMQWYDAQIFLNGALMFVQLGQSASGNRALGQTFTKMFYRSLIEIADLVAAELTAKIVQPLCLWNGWAMDARVTHEGLEQEDVLAFTEQVENVWKPIMEAEQAGDTETANVMREKVGLPMSDEDGGMEMEEETEMEEMEDE